MLKLLFWLLLIGNGILFAMQRGYVGAATPERHEPQRLAQQLQPQTLSILPPDSEKLALAKQAPASTATAAPADASAGADAAAKNAAPAADSQAPAPAPAAAPAASPAPAPAAAPAAAAKSGELIACLEIGNFNSVEARRFETQLEALHLAVKAGSRSVQEASSYMVYLPAQDGRDGADRRTAELRRLGVQDFYVIPESQPNPALRWAISLGVFKTEEAAKAYIGQLIPMGVRSARIMARNINNSRLAYQWRNLDQAGKAALDGLMDKFSAQQQHACSS